MGVGDRPDTPPRAGHPLFHGPACGERMTAVMVPPATAVRAGPGMRLLRAAVFTAVCVVLAAAGHTLASGAPVPVWSLVFGWLAVLAVVAPLAGRERTLPGIAAALAAGQLALHTVFGAGQMCAT